VAICECKIALSQARDFIAAKPPDEPQVSSQGQREDKPARQVVRSIPHP
jgi:hypothetical protein